MIDPVDCEERHDVNMKLLLYNSISLVFVDLLEDKFWSLSLPLLNPKYICLYPSK
uniref:Uncharacterized protein n=1 Tax=Nelumbo nucifera TaxID=4432 RepID=A0A822ZHC9_NELNU|nr:TPA_asm: hypothetical protein HUJ06_002263 [Nelumbo nucifera]